MLSERILSLSSILTKEKKPDFEGTTKDSLSVEHKRVQKDACMRTLASVHFLKNNALGWIGQQCDRVLALHGLTQDGT